MKFDIFISQSQYSTFDYSYGTPLRVRNYSILWYPLPSIQNPLSHYTPRASQYCRYVYRWSENFLGKYFCTLWFVRTSVALPDDAFEGLVFSPSIYRCTIRYYLLFESSQSMHDVRTDVGNVDACATRIIALTAAT